MDKLEPRHEQSSPATSPVRSRYPAPQGAGSLVALTAPTARPWPASSIRMPTCCWSAIRWAWCSMACPAPWE
ncbi:hypothetical protein ACPA9J_07405 [Pseudomonas aeruginosa]